MKEEIVIIGTGGTIAGKAGNGEDTTGYTAGSFPMESIVEAVPGIEKFGPFRMHQLCNIDSSDMTFSQWMELAKLVQEEVDKESVQGVIIMHGSDTMEEGAYFLHLLVHTKKPIVMTGSMRPATAISADGPMNLWESAMVCRSNATAGMGVVVVLNGKIHGAREVMKEHTTNVDTFGNAIYGCLGTIQGEEVFMEQMPVRAHTEESPFQITEGDMPKVAILTLYPDMDASLVETVLCKNYDGIVIAGLGHGMIPQKIRSILAEKKKDTILVKAARVWSGAVTETPSDAELHMLPAGSLSAVKARILLMLALQQTRDISMIREYFKAF